VAWGGKDLSQHGVLGPGAWQIMGVDGWRSKCDNDGKKKNTVGGAEQLFGEVGRIEDPLQAFVQ
jgi:hypothetical protein